MDRPVVPRHGEDTRARYPGDEPRRAVEQDVGHPNELGRAYPHQRRDHRTLWTVSRRFRMHSSGAIEFSKARTQELQALRPGFQPGMESQRAPLELLQVHRLRLELFPATSPPGPVLHHRLPLLPELGQHLFIVALEYPATRRARRVGARGLHAFDSGPQLSGPIAERMQRGLCILSFAVPIHGRDLEVPVDFRDVGPVREQVPLRRAKLRGHLLRIDPHGSVRGPVELDRGSLGRRRVRAEPLERTIGQAQSSALGHSVDGSSKRPVQGLRLDPRPPARNRSFRPRPSRLEIQLRHRPTRPSASSQNRRQPKRNRRAHTPKARKIPIQCLDRSVGSPDRRRAVRQQLLHES